jgi:hypothetical protein
MAAKASVFLTLPARDLGPFFYQPEKISFSALKMLHCSIII